MACGSRLTGRTFNGMKISNMGRCFVLVCRLFLKTVEIVSLEGIVYATFVLFMITKREDTMKLIVPCFQYLISKFLLDSNFSTCLGAENCLQEYSRLN